MSLTEDFLNIEKKYGLNSIEVDGFTPWVYTRFGLWNSYMNPLNKLPETGFVKIRRLLKQVLCTVRILTMRSNPPANADICFFNDSRQVLLDGLYVNKCTYALTGHFPGSVILQQYNSSGHYEPTKESNVIFTSKAELCGLLRKFAAGYIRPAKYRSVYRQLLSLFTVPIRELSETSGVDISPEKWAKMAANKYFTYKAYYKWYKKFLSRVSPRIIVEVCHYSTGPMVINEIAKNMGIPTVELQHGIIDDDHLAYNYPQGETIAQFPDKLFLFGEFWKTKAIYPLNTDSLIPVGFPYFEQEIDKYKDKRKQETKVLLFLSQPIISARSQFDKLAADVLERLSKKGWSVVFKLHPGEYNDWKRRYPRLADSDIEVVGSNRPLYELLSKASAVAGLNSTAIFEALGFGLCAYIFNIFGSERMDDLCKLGYAEKFNNAADLCQKLETATPPNASASVEIWKPDAINNMTKEIDKLLNL